MEVNVKFGRPSKKTFFVLGIILAVSVLAYFVITGRSQSTIPASIPKQTNYKTVYPPSELAPKGFAYSDQTKTLSYTLTFNGNQMNVTEQLAPDSLVTGSNVYFQALGIHPTAQFATSYGQVAIANFYQTGTLAMAGQSGLLVAGKTLVIINPNDSKKSLNSDQWKQLFDSLKLSK